MSAVIHQMYRLVAVVFVFVGIFEGWQNVAQR